MKSNERELSIEEIKESMISNTSPLTISEKSDLLSSKTDEELLMKMKKYATKYRYQ